ncbi:MAG: hypothetical protein JO346_14435 [Alphaproteobacteria bacterium]|nr:hypothetical protein [Alphaproteobacteria bacterium]
MRIAASLVAIALLTVAPAEAADSVLHLTRTLPEHGPLVVPAPMPEIGDWHSLKITLHRSMCFGRCPAYTVTVDGSGRVVFNGESDTAVQGEARRRISRAAVRRLYAAFRAAQFFSLRDEYRAQVTDLPEYRIGIAFDGTSKSVLDYAGPMAGMPQAVRDLEDLIDKTAGTAKWIKPMPRLPRPDR